MFSRRRKGRPAHEDVLTPKTARWLFLSQQEKPADGESILYLRVPDIKQAHEELQARGVEFTGAPHMIHRHADGTEEWMAFFKDPEGRPLAIMAQVKPTA